MQQMIWYVQDCRNTLATLWTNIKANSRERIDIRHCHFGSTYKPKSMARKKHHHHNEGFFFSFFFFLNLSVQTGIGLDWDFVSRLNNDKVIFVKTSFLEKSRNTKTYA